MRAQLSGNEAFVGETLTVQVVVVNMSVRAVPIPPDAEDFTITPDPGNPVGQSSRTSIGLSGRRTSSSEFTYLYRVQPRRLGRLVLPPFAVKHKGRVYHTQQFPIVVKKGTAGDYLICKIKAEPETAYVGQAVKLTLEVWVQQFSQRGFGKLDATTMWGLRDKRATTPGIFDRVDWEGLRYYEATRENDAGVTAQYFVYLLETTVYPTKAGPFDFGGVAVAYHYPKRLGRGDGFLLSRWRLQDSRRLRAAAEGPALEIKPIPTEGRPPDFNGAVGAYSIATWAKPTEVPVGDPITLTLAIRGTGPLDRLSPPKLDGVAALARDFEISGKSLAGEIKSGRKLFTQTIRALREDVAEIPPIPISYFDPETGRFETDWSDSIPLTVRPAERLALSSVSAAGSQGVLMPLVETTEGLLANEADPARVLADQSGRLGTGWLIILAGMPLAYTVTWIVQRRAARYRDDEALRRRSRAYARAKRLLHDTEAAEAPAQAGAALLGYIADRCNAPPQGLTHADAVRLITERRVPPETVDAVDKLLAGLDQAQYGGGAGDADRAVPAQTRRLLETLERCKLK